MKTRKILREDELWEPHWIIEWQEQYSQFFQDDNWLTYNPVYIEFENDKIGGAFEFIFIVLGLGIRVRWNHTETEHIREWKRMIKEITEEEDDERPETKE